MAQYLAALDQGTTSSRAVIFTADGQVVASCNREFPQHYPKPGWVEHDPRDILDSQVASLREAVRLAAANLIIKALSFGFFSVALTAFATTRSTPRVKYS